MKYRPEIDGLRALAVLPVILFHTGWGLFSGGYIGVDVFFVISGYLISSIILDDIEKEEFSFTKFYDRRARRILPALFTVMFVAIPFAWLWLLPADFRDFSESITAATLFVSNILFWKESGYFETTEALKPLIHTWSLGIEEQFYLLYPIFLIAIFRYIKKHFVLTVTIVFLLSLVLSEYMSREYIDADFFLLPTRGWELFTGAGLAIFERGNDWKLNERVASLLTISGLVLIFTSVIMFDKETRHPGIITLFPVAGTALIISFGKYKSIVNRFLSQKYIVGIGLISYSLYLWHQPVFAFARHYSIKIITPGIYGVLILLSFLLALLSYKYIETPFRKRDKIKTKHFIILVLAISAGFVSFGIAGSITNGFPGRIPDDLLMKIEGDSYKKIYVKTTDEWEHCYEKDEACFIGAENKPVSWALVGDSHAGALAGSFDASLRNLGERGVFLARKGCVYAVALNRVDKQDECYEHNNFVRLRLLEADIEKIVISGRYVLGLEKERFNNGEGGVESGLSVVLVPEKYTDDKNRRKQVLASFSGSIEELLKSGKKIYLIYPVPEVGWDVPRMAFKQKFKGINEPISTSAELFYKRSGPVIGIFDSLTAIENLVRIYPDKMFCNTVLPGRCVTELDGKILYADDNHLSENGVNLIIKMVLDSATRQ